MSDDFIRLVYYSRNRVAGTSEEIGDTIRSILEASRRNNSEVGVTGALMFNAGCFAQVLEGPRNAVESTFERIQQDPRHGEVSLLSLDAADSRAFPTWSMAFVGESLSDTDRFGTIGTETGFDPSRMSGNAVFEVLHGLVLEEEKSAA